MVEICIKISLILNFINCLSISEQNQTSCAKIYKNIELVRMKFQLNNIAFYSYDQNLIPDSNSV